MKPCRRCGGEKEPGRPGKVRCIECDSLGGDATKQMLAERARGKRTKVREARIAGLVPPPVNRVFKKDCPPGTKWCNRCQAFRPLTSFGKSACYCIPCNRQYNRQRHLREKFGMTWEEYEALYESQGERCAICEGRPRKHLLAVDHCHATGEVRGLLCSKCNHKLLGSANDDPARLRKAADYLEANLARQVFGEPRYIPTKAVA